MNERIKELSIKAGFPEWSNHAIEFELEKFAELIISECASLAKSKSEHIEGIETEDHDDQVLLHSLAWRFEEFGYEIKKHFGVKE